MFFNELNCFSKFFKLVVLKVDFRKNIFWYCPWYFCMSVPPFPCVLVKSQPPPPVPLPVPKDRPPRSCLRTSCPNPALDLKRPWCRRCLTKTMYWRQKKSRVRKKISLAQEKYALHHLAKYGIDEDTYDQGLKVRAQTIKRRKAKHRKSLMSYEQLKRETAKNQQLRAQLVAASKNITQLMDPNFVIETNKSE